MASFIASFGPDAIFFDSSISFNCGSRDDDTETVAYYYRIPDTESAPVVTPDEWLVTGFYENGGDWDTFNAAENVESIPLDQWASHFADREHFIRTIPANRGWLDWRFSGIDPELTAANFTNRSMYAGSIFESDEDKDAVLRLAYDDWLILWVNDEKVETLKSEGQFETVRIPIKLKKGRNEFRLKSNNLGHVWNAWVSNIAILF